MVLPTVNHYILVYHCPASANVKVNSKLQLLFMIVFFSVVVFFTTLDCDSMFGAPESENGIFCAGVNGPHQLSLSAELVLMMVLVAKVA